MDDRLKAYLLIEVDIASLSGLYMDLISSDLYRVRKDKSQILDIFMLANQAHLHAVGQDLLEEVKDIFEDSV